MLAEPVQITQQVTKVLEEFGILYAVGGSLASSLHGIPRATQDADIIANLQPQHILPLAEILETQGFYVDVDLIQEAVKRRSSFNIIHLATMFKVDIFVLPNDPVSQTEIMRREPYCLAKEPTPVFFIVSAEDIIIHKLHWFHLGGGVSERQWRDILGVLQVRQHRLDYEYLKTVAEHRRVTELLEQALTDRRT